MRNFLFKLEIKHMFWHWEWGKISALNNENLNLHGKIIVCKLTMRYNLTHLEPDNRKTNCYILFILIAHLDGFVKSF